MGTLREFAVGMDRDNRASTAWELFEPLIKEWIRETAPRRVLEIGGGRHPLLSPEEVVALPSTRYVVNDISPRELDRLEPIYGRACFDIQIGPTSDDDSAGEFDLAFSRMVFEHIRDPAAAWRTVHRLLRPGGTALMFMPVLFAPPFVINKMVPDRLSAVVVRRLFPRRHAEDIPKFPAYYRWCRASYQYLYERLAPIGFGDIEIREFYGHDYFASIPMIRNLDHLLTSAARRHSWSALASYAYVFVTK